MRGTAEPAGARGCGGYPGRVPWLLIWVVLVVGAGVTGFLVWRSLWRSGRALLAEVGELSDLVDGAEERARARALPTTTPAPVVLDDPGPARERLAQVRALRAERLRRRADRHEAVYRRWWSFVR